MTAIGLATVLGAVGCTSWTPPPESGPQLVVDVTNRSAEERITSFTFEAGTTSGAGEGSVPACSRSAATWGEIGGRFSVAMDGETIYETAVPAGVPDDGYLVVGVSVDQDGRAEVTREATWTRLPPEVDPRPLPNCG